MTVLTLNSQPSVEHGIVRADLNAGFKLQIEQLEPYLCRVALVPMQGPAVDKTWMIAPDGEVPWSGRGRLERDGFNCQALSINDGDVVGENLRIQLQADPLALTLSHLGNDGQWRTVLQDRPMAAYRSLPGRSVMQHAQLRPLDALHLGLGDKAGSIDRTGRRFRCLQTDALGYNAETSDPLYKHVPWFIAGNQASGYCGVFYDTMAECVFDFGAEHSNYHEHYRSVESYEQALIYYVVSGPELSQVVPRFQQLVGKPHLQPRWASGFAFTSMHHADADNAQAVMEDFITQCKQRDIPISALHSGSGYTTRDDGRRYVFTWNTGKFPDRKSFFEKLQQAGMYSCANIKPVLLTEHPLFDEVAAFNGFITDGDGNPAIEMFWGGPGASIDFTNPDSVAWWQSGVKEQVIGAGFTATWNDNNECEIWDEQARLHGFGKPVRAMDLRPIQALLMTRASFEAATELDPDHRPYTITRAGPVGISRYAQTWTGDNETSWHTLKWNLANGLSLSLSGFPLHGHDIGGFVGPKPDAELLCRWFEMMVVHPRAVMNSWKPAENNPASLPWMHESVEGLIRNLLHLRYQFLPWLYHLGWRAHADGDPVITPMLYQFSDEPCQYEMSQFMVGDTLLVAPVVEQGATSREVYLPVCEQGWYAWLPDKKSGGADTARWIAGGEKVTVDAPLGELTVFVRAGAILPIATAWKDNQPHDATEITLMYFATPATGETEQPVFYDDGVSWQFQKQQGAGCYATMKCSANSVAIEFLQEWNAGSPVKWMQRIVGLNGRKAVNQEASV